MGLILRFECVIPCSYDTKTSAIKGINEKTKNNDFIETEENGI